MSPDKISAQYVDKITVHYSAPVHCGLLLQLI
jgi:hypothetical protein